MKKSHRSRIVLLAAAVATSAWLVAPGAPLAREAKENRACTSAYKQAKKQEQDNQLRAAEKSWLACAKASCSTFLQHECTFHHAQIQADIPSIVPVVTDAAGAPVTDAQVTMDGQLLTSKIDGRALAIDPGVHEFAFRNGSGLLATEKIVITQGQRNRLVTISLRPGGREAQVQAQAQAQDNSAASATTGEIKPAVLERSAAPAESLIESPPAGKTGPAGSRSVAPYLLGTVGVAGLAGFGVLTYWGRKDNDRLAGCSPNCMPGSLDHIKRLYLGANIALGVGIAALVGATWVALASGPSKEDAASHGRYAFGLAPTASGATASFAGAF